MKEKNKQHMFVSVDAEKTFDKIKHSLLLKTLRELIIEWNFLSMVKIIYGKPKLISYLGND